MNVLHPICETMSVLVELRLTTYVRIVGIMTNTYLMLDEMLGLWLGF